MLRRYRSASGGPERCPAAAPQVIFLNLMGAGSAQAFDSHTPALPTMGAIGLFVVAILCAVAGVFILLRKS